MITIDQGRIDAPKFPRDQEWWQGFAPIWVKATVRDDGTVTLEPSGTQYDYSPGADPLATIHRELSAAERKRYGKYLAQWVGRLPRISKAIIPDRTCDDCGAAPGEACTWDCSSNWK